MTRKNKRLHRRIGTDFLSAPFGKQDEKDQPGGDRLRGNLELYKFRLSQAAPTHLAHPAGRHPAIHCGIPKPPSFSLKNKAKRQRKAIRRGFSPYCRQAAARHSFEATRRAIQKLWECGLRLSRSGRFDRSSSRLRAWRVLSFQVPAPSSLVGSTNSRRARPSAASSDSAIGPVAELHRPVIPDTRVAAKPLDLPRGWSGAGLAEQATV